MDEQEKPKHSDRPDVTGAIRPVRTTRRSGYALVALAVTAVIAWGTSFVLMATRFNENSTSTATIASFAVALLLTVVCLTMVVDHRMQARSAGLAGGPGTTMRTLQQGIYEADRSWEERFQRAEHRHQCLAKQVKHLTAAVQALRDTQVAERTELINAVRTEVHAAVRLSEDERADQLLVLMTQVLDRLVPGYATKVQHINGSSGGVRRLPTG